jgi:hypothetical protein
MPQTIYLSKVFNMRMFFKIVLYERVNLLTKKDDTDR